MKTPDPNNPLPVDANSQQSQPTFIQLARTPLVPERVLKSYGAYCAIDTRFRAGARLLQCLWLRENGISSALSAENAFPYDSFGSVLSAEAARSGKNFFSEDIHHLALQEWLLCEEGAAIDDERLFGNALSSMPLIFNLFGPLALDLKLATVVFRVLLPDFVRDVERLAFETSPGRRSDRFLADRSSFDLAAYVQTTDGHKATIYIEMKYSESMEGPAARMRDRYNEASHQVRLYRDPDAPILRSLALEQLWREGMMAQLAVDNGVTPRALFMAIGPRLNRRVQAAFRVYHSELLDVDNLESDRVPFVPLTLETVIEAIATAGAIEHAQALWSRYCDFERIYRLSLEELTGIPSSQPKQNHHSTDAPALPQARRPIGSTNARAPRTRSSGAPGHSRRSQQGAV